MDAPLDADRATHNVLEIMDDMATLVPSDLRERLSALELADGGRASFRRDGQLTANYRRKSEKSIRRVMAPLWSLLTHGPRSDTWQHVRSLLVDQIANTGSDLVNLLDQIAKGQKPPKSAHRALVEEIVAKMSLVHEKANAPDANLDTALRAFLAQPPSFEHLSDADLREQIAAFRESAAEAESFARRCEAILADRRAAPPKP